MKSAIAVNLSKNEKTGPVSATYAPIQTCPQTCPLRNNGCYAQDGNCNLHFSRISRNAQSKTLIEIAEFEANEIQKLRGNLPLRLHVTGDCPNDETAKIISRACTDYQSKHGKPVWVYTHAWRDVARESWGSVSVLASCEKPGQVVTARKRGYRSVLVTPLHRIVDHTQSLSWYGVRSRLCGHFTRKQQCVECRACLHETQTCILLPTHGSRVNRVDQVIDEMR